MQTVFLFGCPWKKVQSEYFKKNLRDQTERTCLSAVQKVPKALGKEKF